MSIKQVKADEPLKYSSCTELISVPSFLLKAYEILSNPTYNSIVRWTGEGDAFIITDKNQFSDKVLPIYFKHKNLSSFIRQLNIYGFKKTKYKSEEHCFAHKYFRKDNKLLLLKMKRNTKRKHSDKKSQSSEDGYIKRTEVVEMLNNINDRLTEQDTKIERLVQANKEFKNSVLALYTQLEESKKREKRLEKVLASTTFDLEKAHIELAPFIQKEKRNTLLNEELTEQLKDKYASESTFRLSNNDLFKLFTSFIQNFMKTLNTKDVDNIFFDKKKNKFEYYSRSPSPGSRNIFPQFEIQKYNQPNMLENGPAYSPERAVKLDMFGKPFSRESSITRPKYQLLEGENDIWERLSEIRLNRDDDNIVLIEDLDNKEDVKHTHQFDCDRSMLSDIEVEKVKQADEESVGSNRKYSELISNHENRISLRQPIQFLPSCVNSFDLGSQNNDEHEDDEDNSVSSFSIENQFCGYKRQKIK
jgi:heat shock transcription factor, other eukaryote